MANPRYSIVGKQVVRKGDHLKGTVVENFRKGQFLVATDHGIITTNLKSWRLLEDKFEVRPADAYQMGSILKKVANGDQIRAVDRQLAAALHQILARTVISKIAAGM